MYPEGIVYHSLTSRSKQYVWSLGECSDDVRTVVYGGHGPCARYAFRKRTAQRVEVFRPGVHPSIQPDDDGAAPGARSPARDDAPAPRPCMHAAAARVPPPAQHSTAQHETGSGACTPVCWWWWWRALSCRSFPRLHRSRERPRPAFRKGAHNARTGRALGKRRAQTQLGPRSVSAAVGWVGLGDDERRLSLRWLARAQCQWTGGAARARPRRVGVTAMAHEPPRRPGGRSRRGRVL